MTEPETIADKPTCTECGRRPLRGERWSLRFTEIGEVAAYCPECDNREFGVATSTSDSGGPWAGVDVGGTGNGFHCALVDRRSLLTEQHLATASDTVEWLLENRPMLAAVDGPRTPARAGQQSRPAERALAQAGICNIRFTPDEAGLASNPIYYDWIYNGFRLYRECEAASVDVIECFPTASWTRWAGPKGERTRAAWTRAALQDMRLRDIPSSINQHRRDAIGAALTARAHADGETEAFGDIVVPRRRSARVL
jgi:predicted nuclease with RNAse H fold